MYDQEEDKNSSSDPEHQLVEVHHNLHDHHNTTTSTTGEYNDIISDNNIISPRSTFSTSLNVHARNRNPEGVDEEEEDRIQNASFESIESRGEIAKKERRHDERYVEEEEVVNLSPAMSSVKSEEEDDNEKEEKCLDCGSRNCITREVKVTSDGHHPPKIYKGLTKIRYNELQLLHKRVSAIRDAKKLKKLGAIIARQQDYVYTSEQRTRAYFDLCVLDDFTIKQIKKLLN